MSHGNGHGRSFSNIPEGVLDEQKPAIPKWVPLIILTLVVIVFAGMLTSGAGNSNGAVQALLALAMCAGWLLALVLVAGALAALVRYGPPTGLVVLVVLLLLALATGLLDLNVIMPALKGSQVVVHHP